MKDYYREWPLLRNSRGLFICLFIYALFHDALNNSVYDYVINEWRIRLNTVVAYYIFVHFFIITLEAPWPFDPKRPL